MTYHLVDLRGDGYRGGHLDTDARILLACFKLFEEFFSCLRGAAPAAFVADPAAPPSGAPDTRGPA